MNKESINENQVRSPINYDHDFQPSPIGNRCVSDYNGAESKRVKSSHQVLVPLVRNHGTYGVMYVPYVHSYITHLLSSREMVVQVALLTCYRSGYLTCRFPEALED